MNKQQVHEKQLFTIKELMVYTSLGESKAREWAKEIGAGYKVGRRTVYDKTIIDKAIDNLPRSGNEAGDSPELRKEDSTGKNTEADHAAGRERYATSPELPHRIRDIIQKKDERIQALEAEIEKYEEDSIFEYTSQACQLATIMGKLVKMLRKNGVEISLRQILKWMKDEGFMK